MTSLSRKDWILLVLLTLCWGINWPIMKMGVQFFPPIAFRSLCMLGSLPILWLAVRSQGASFGISRSDLGTMLSSGRAAILGYTMPIWAVLCGLIFFRDNITRLGWCGIALALSGALLLLSSEFVNMAGQPLGSILALIAAASWGYGTVLMKRTKLNIASIALTFWMIFLGAICLALISALLEYEAWRLPNLKESLAIAYNALLVFGFGQAIWFSLARTLPPIASSLSVMMIPVLGVFSGMYLLNETPHWQDFVAMLLILAAMSTVLLKPRTNVIK
jgi:drug/metabolite transporter (DMT)-like permease